MAKKSAQTKSNHEAVSISTEQWEMPAGFSADGSKMVPLRDVVDPQMATLSLDQLTPDQRAELVAKRIELQPKFEVAMVGAGKVDKRRAMAEVKVQSEVGRLLMEIEHRLINDLVERARQRK